MVEATLSDEASELHANPLRLQQYADKPDRQLRLLLELNSIAHERIHYLDTFGTIAGISLLTARIQLLREFLEVSGRLAAKQTPWQLPLSKWLQRTDVPPAVKSVAGLARTHSNASQLFVAAVEPFMVEGRTDEAWIDLPFQPRGRTVTINPSIPAFPLSIEVVEPTGVHPGRPVTVFHPLGYEAILEGRAHAMARSYIESVFIDAPRDLLANYGPARRRMPSSTLPDQLPVSLAKQFQIYNITDFMVSKFLRRRGISEFSRDLVLQLSDRALSQSMLHIRRLNANQNEVSFTSPGAVFVSLMSELPSTTSPTVDYPEQVTDMYHATLSNLEKGEDWNMVTGIQPYMSLRIWESFMAQHITVPLLRRRLETHHAVYTSGSVLMDLITSLALPRVEIINGRLFFHHMPPAVQSAWASQMFLGEIADQLFADATTIRCPRAHRLLPGLDTVDFANGQCAASIRRGCGSCTGGVPSHEVACMFNVALRSYGLALRQPPLATVPK